MCGSFAEARAPGTPPDPSCPLIWVRRAVPPYASLTVSCSACSSSRDSSGSGFNPHKQPASSLLALCHSSVVCWFGGGCRGLWDYIGNSRGLVIKWESLNELSFFMFDAFLRGWIVHLFFFLVLFFTSHRKCCYIRWDLLTIFMLYMNRFYLDVVAAYLTPTLLNTVKEVIIAYFIQ